MKIFFEKKNESTHNKYFLDFLGRYHFTFYRLKTFNMLIKKGFN